MLYGWKDNSMLTNCLAACAHLSITVSEMQRDICEKIGVLSYPLAFDDPVREVPTRISAPLRYGKTRMVSLPDGEKISKIYLFVLTYLGSDIDSDGYSYPEIHRRLGAASLAPLWLNLTKSGVSKDSVSPPSSEYTPLLCSR